MVVKSTKVLEAVFSVEWGQIQSMNDGWSTVVVL